MKLAVGGNEGTTGGRRTVASGLSDATGVIDEGNLEDTEGPVWVTRVERSCQRILLAAALVWALGR